MCLETLAANSEKAALVRALAVECTRDNPDENWKAMTCLVKVLTNMHSLSDFRLRMRPRIANFWFRDRKKVISNINKILWLVYEVLIFSKLTILLEIQWKPFSIKNSLLRRCTGHLRNHRESTRITATWNTPRSGKPFETSQTFSWCSIRVIPSNHLYIASLYSVDRSATIPQLLAKSFEEDRGYHVSADVDRGYHVDRVYDLSIYLIDSSDMPTVYALTSSMAWSFRRISRLNFWFERQCEIVSFLLHYDRTWSKAYIYHFSYHRR